MKSPLSFPQLLIRSACLAALLLAGCASAPPAASDNEPKASEASSPNETGDGSDNAVKRKANEKTDRQVSRVGDKVDQKVDEKTDEAVDSVLDKAWNKVFK